MTVQPLPVEAFAARFTAEGRVALTWSPVTDPLEPSAAPSGYMVYTRVDDGGFDEGRYVDRPQLEVDQREGHIYSYRVTAVNAGGESFPSETLAVYAAPESRGEVLIVNGFERISAPVSQRADSLVGFLTSLDGGVPDRVDISFIGPQRVYDPAQLRCNVDSLALGACDGDFATDVIGGNTFDYPYLHGRSVAAAGYSFSSASLRAVERGEVPLGDYPAVDLILGKQRTTTIGRGVCEAEFATFSPELQRRLRGYLADGGALFASGCYVASDLWENPEGNEGEEGNEENEGRRFAREVLHVGDDGSFRSPRGRVQVMAAHPDFSRGEYRFHTGYGRDHYTVETVNALTPADASAFAVMRYADDGRTAAVACESGGRTLVAGFPFESIANEALRDRLMRDALRFLLGETTPAGPEAVRDANRYEPKL